MTDISDIFDEKIEKLIKKNEMYEKLKQSEYRDSQIEKNNSRINELLSSKEEFENKMNLLDKLPEKKIEEYVKNNSYRLFSIHPSVNGIKEYICELCQINKIEEAENIIFDLTWESKIKT